MAYPKITIILTMTIILLLVAGGYIANDKLIKPYYQQQGINAVIIQINTNGNIPIINNGTINWIPLSNLCGVG